MRRRKSLLRLHVFLLLLACLSTVAQGAGTDCSRGQKTGAEVGSTRKSISAELAPHTSPCVTTVSPRCSDISARRDENLPLPLSKSGWRPRASSMGSDNVKVVEMFPKNDVTVNYKRDLQRGPVNDGGARSNASNERADSPQADVPGAPKKSGPQRLSSDSAKGSTNPPMAQSSARRSRIPISSSHARLSTLNRRTTSMSSCRGTSLDSAHGCSPKSHSTLEKMGSRLTNPGLSSLDFSFKARDVAFNASRRLPTTSTAYLRRTHEKTLTANFIAGKVCAAANPTLQNNSHSTDGDDDKGGIGRQAHRHMKSRATTTEKTSSEADGSCSSGGSSKRSSAESSEPAAEQGTDLSMVRVKQENIPTLLEDSLEDRARHIRSSQMLIRFRQATAFPVLDESKFLLNQSIESKFPHLFQATLPELRSIAENLRATGGNVPCAAEEAVARAVSHILGSVDPLMIGPLSDRRAPPTECSLFQVVPTRLIGAGGSSLVYQMEVPNSSEEVWAVKMHYCWAEGKPDHRGLEFIYNSVRESVTSLIRYLSREYTPYMLFRKFRFLVPYVVGEFVGLDKVIISHESDPRRHLLNLVTVLPLLPGSFDAVLSLGELSFSAKRVTCFSFVELVARLHLQKLIHGDLKPTNFFINWDGRVYLGDFDTVGRNNSRRRCGSMATLDFLDPQDAQCHVKTPAKRVPLSAARDAWALGLSLFLVWCGTFPFEFLDVESTLSPHMFLDGLLALTPNAAVAGYTTPQLDFRSCPGGAIHDGLVLELIQRFLELDRSRRLTPIAAYKLILSAGNYGSDSVHPVFF